ncbi:hypothetical protein Anapl_10186 [Anas platyrhynchos]|uniref:Uncharacterized protein n=1 Tax=Anas platyrhynchos TaxID=8839 RepID=R0LBZ8_ANAPL|nr:hypothetical protein Anapl_10186 [Anas platyrhynchos]
MGMLRARRPFSPPLVANDQRKKANMFRSYHGEGENNTEHRLALVQASLRATKSSGSLAAQSEHMDNAAISITSEVQKPRAKLAAAPSPINANLLLRWQNQDFRTSQRQQAGHNVSSYISKHDLTYQSDLHLLQPGSCPTAGKHCFPRITPLEETLFLFNIGSTRKGQSCPEAGASLAPGMAEYRVKGVCMALNGKGMKLQAEGQGVDPGCSHAKKINFDLRKTEWSVQKCPLPVHSDLKMPPPTLPSPAVFAADDLDFHMSLPITLFFHSSLQTMNFLNCNSMLPEPHPHLETDLHPSSNAELLNCQCGTKHHEEAGHKNNLTQKVDMPERIPKCQPPPVSSVQLQPCCTLLYSHHPVNSQQSLSLGNGPKRTLPVSSVSVKPTGAKLQHIVLSRLVTWQVHLSTRLSRSNQLHDSAAAEQKKGFVEKAGYNPGTVVLPCLRRGYLASRQIVPYYRCLVIVKNVLSSTFKILLTELILNNIMHSSQQTSKAEGVLDSQFTAKNRYYLALGMMISMRGSLQNAYAENDILYLILADPSLFVIEVSFATNRLWGKITPERLYKTRRVALQGHDSSPQWLKPHLAVASQPCRALRGHWAPSTGVREKAPGRHLLPLPPTPSSALQGSAERVLVA